MIATLAALRGYCAAKPGCREDFPFGEGTLVFKVGGRMFALCGLDDDPLRVNLKCDPEFAELLRGRYPAITPGWHMNKRHWNTVVLDGSLPEGLVETLIDDSYALVAKGLTRAQRAAL